MAAFGKGIDHIKFWPLALLLRQPCKCKCVHALSLPSTESSMSATENCKIANLWRRIQLDALNRQLQLAAYPELSFLKILLAANGNQRLLDAVGGSASYLQKDVGLEGTGTALFSHMQALKSIASL